MLMSSFAGFCQGRLYPHAPLQVMQTGYEERSGLFTEKAFMLQVYTKDMRTREQGAKRLLVLQERCR